MLPLRDHLPFPSFSLGLALRCQMPGYGVIQGSIGASLVAQAVKNLPPMWNTWVGKIPWRIAWQSTQYSCLENPHGQRSTVGYSPWDHKESDRTEWLSTAQGSIEDLRQGFSLSNFHFFCAQLIYDNMCYPVDEDFVVWYCLKHISVIHRQQSSCPAWLVSLRVLLVWPFLACGVSLLPELSSSSSLMMKPWWAGIVLSLTLFSAAA